MMHQLQLRYAPASDAAPDAWFLPGDSVAWWLEELVRSGLATMETQLFVVPQSLDNCAVAGLLVVPTKAGPGSISPTGIGCRRVGERLYIPHDAELHPPVTDDELRLLLPLPVSFYHPVFGLSGFETENASRVNDLIQMPEEQPGTWNYARPGVPPMPELSALVLRQPPSIEDIIGGAQDDIGSEPLMDLPPAADETPDNIGAEARRKLRRMIAKGLAGIMRHVPHTASQRNWLNNIEDWANRQLRGVNNQLEQLRNKELNRLLHLLDKDPDEGLRRAIPMNSFAHRGTAPPSNQLGLRSLNFDPTKLGGRPADFWNIPNNLQDALRRRYREMADREMQLGRHRRAAYIYAELLGDLVSAASAFKKGKLFREAALLYDEHLKNPLEAARCFAEAGLLAEAIERYEKLGQWLEVADLYDRSGNPAAAAEAIRKVIKERLTHHDVLGAAKLMEERLRAPDEALELLLNAWPGSPQAANAIGAAFQLLARLGRHEVALECLARFERDPVTHGMVLPLVSTLARTAREYPHEHVRHRAADFSRVLIAGQLGRPGFQSDQARQLLDCLIRLAPQDRLLSRDVNRYLANLGEAELRKRRATPPPVDGKKPDVRKTFKLPRQIQWLHLRSEWHWFYALGITPKQITVIRGMWDGEYQSLSWDYTSERAKIGFVFEPTQERGRALVIARQGDAPFPTKIFPGTDRFFNQKCLAGTPSWLPTQGFPVGIGENSVWTIHIVTERAILSCYEKTRGQLQRTIDVTVELLTDAKSDEQTRLSLAVMSNSVAVALGNRLVVTNSDGTLTRVELPGQVIGLVPTILNTRRGVAVMLHSGAMMYWFGSRECIELDRDIPSPTAAFVPGGPLVLASGLKLQLLEVDARGVQSVTRLELSGSPIAGISATANPGEFAVLNAQGEISVFRMPR